LAFTTVQATLRSGEESKIRPSDEQKYRGKKYVK